MNESKIIAARNLYSDALDCYYVAVRRLEEARKELAQEKLRYERVWAELQKADEEFRNELAKEA